MPAGSLSLGDRARYHEHRTIGKGAMVRGAAGAGFSTLRNSPHEWGRGGTGFVKRFGSGLATRGIKNGIEFGVGAWRHEDPRYYRSNAHGFFPKLKSAAINTVTVHKDRGNHKRTVAAGRLAGNFGSGLISRAWMPASASGIGAGLATGGIGLGADFGANVAKEFWPHKKERGGKAVHRRRT